LAEATETSFGEAARHRLVEEFAVSFYNGSLRPNLAEKNPANGRDIEYLMDGPQFERTKRTDIWSYSNAVGTGYQYRVVYKDKRYTDLERLLEMYSGTVSTADMDHNAIEQQLYEFVMLMIKEGRLPKTFKIQTPKEAQNEKLVSMVDELGRSLEELGRRVRKLEEQLAVQNQPEPQMSVGQPLGSPT
jgi:hypothetical protein